MLNNFYAKISRKSVPNKFIRINNFVHADLEWAAHHLEHDSGVRLFHQIYWDAPSTDVTLFCDTCLEGMGFWLPDNCVGFYSPTPEGTTDEHIFYLKALCVLSAIHYVTDTLHVSPTAEILIYTDNDNTITIFNMFRCLPHYNPILINAAKACITSHIQLRVLHIPGEQNCVADAISQKNFTLAQQYVPNLVISTFLPPSIAAGGSQKMISSTVHARQPPRQAWTHERLLREHAIALGQAVDNSTWKNYGSALNSYLNFIKLHNFPLDPTPDTLSLFTVYMCHHIKLRSVTTYLSGICHQLEPYFPDVRTTCNSALVHRTLQGCKRLCATPTTCNCTLTLGDLESVVNALALSTDYNNILFLTQLLTGFFALFHLGEMTYPDDPQLRDP